jgi:hypothetical protein
MAETQETHEKLSLSVNRDEWQALDLSKERIQGPSHIGFLVD